MTSSLEQLDRLEALSVRLIDTLAARSRLTAAALVALALITYLPGLLALPPVDRTEVVYAEMARGMVERSAVEPGAWLDARFVEERFPFRPIGITWLQAASGTLLGHGAWTSIATWRLPSLLAGVLAVLALWRLAAPLVGERRALIAAALFAVAPIVALQAELAIPEGPLLLAIVVAQLSLLRLYCTTDGTSGTTGLALAFWAAQGFAILLNALAVPILSLATLVALYCFDRDLAWMKRLRPLLGVPLMVLIASPWLLVRAHIDGVPFSGLSFGETLRALGGAQDMKWKAAPLTFTLALALGFLPGALALVPALSDLWAKRAGALQRFLLAWILGYLIYLEAIASKPALYTVQAMFPATALAVALALDRDGRLALPDYTLRLPSLLVAIGMVALFGGILYLRPTGTAGIVLGAVIVTALFTFAAIAARRRLAAAWLTTAVTGFALFIAFTFGVVLPRLERGWPAQRIAEAVQPLKACVPGPVAVLGYREPSAEFLLGERGYPEPAAIAQGMADGTPGVAVIEDRWHGDLVTALAQHGAKLPARAGCVQAFNPMRGCPLSFSIYVSGGAHALASGCAVSSRYACGKREAETPTGAKDSRCR